jgi:hypothetical protein
VFQYSGGVAAEPGYEIERARFAKPLPLADAFAAVEAHLGAIGRPTSAFAACELRSPAPFTEQGFYDFNKAYVTTLERWGIYEGGDQPVNPVARTNVCPMYDKPTEPVMYAFSYTVSARASMLRGTFILAGGGEARSSGNTYKERIVRSLRAVVARAAWSGPTPGRRSSASNLRWTFAAPRARSYFSRAAARQHLPG